MAVVADVLSELVVGVYAVIPRLVAALVVLAVSYPLVLLASRSLRRGLVRAGRNEDVAGLAALIVRLFLLYSVALAVLAVLGFSELAASLGTAIGFVGLGVAYAMKDVIGDVVAGVYLLRDPDISKGDRVVTGEGSGEVVDMGLRKTRILTEEGDRLVVSNSSVDRKWTRKA